MKCEKAKVGKNFRIKLKDDNSSFIIMARLIKNDLQKKVLKFETESDVYECKYNEIIKVESLNKFRLKILFWICIPLLILYCLYRIPSFHQCAYPSIWWCEDLLCKCDYEILLDGVNI